MRCFLSFQHRIGPKHITDPNATYTIEMALDDTKLLFRKLSEVVDTHFHRDDATALC
jgi:hypothetical protein